LCREHGLQLTKALAADTTSNNNTEGPINLFGTVKEVGVDDEGLSEFYHTYFPFPLYRDVNLSLYSALGSRKITLRTWNPFRLYRGYREMKRRLASNENTLTGNLKGEGMVQGGILVFDGTGELRYSYDEEIGEALDMDDIRAAIRMVQQVKLTDEKEL
jgi:AhpC/TSA antioxidant enzyme